MDGAKKEKQASDGHTPPPCSSVKWAEGLRAGSEGNCERAAQLSSFVQVSSHLGVAGAGGGAASAAAWEPFRA